VRAKQRLPVGAQVGLIVAGGLLALAAGYFLLIGPQRSNASDLAQQVEAADAKLAADSAARAAAKRVEPIRVADLFRLSKAMPDRADMSGVLLELNRVAADSGITFESISPQTSVPVSGYQAVPIQLTFKGNFYNLSDFLYRLRTLVGVADGRLAASGRLFAVDTLDFSQAQEGFPEIAATLVVDAFVYGTGVPATATPAPATTTTTTTPLPSVADGATALRVP
jgi:hypothetical protein